MNSGIPNLALSLILLAALSLPVRGQDRNSLPDGQRLNPLDGMKSPDMRSFAERPLFEPSRRPAEVADETNTETEKPAESAPAFVLLGVTSGPEGSVARIARADGQDAHSLRTGEVVNGWTIKSIAPSSVTMAQGDEITVLTIFRGSSEPATETDSAGSSPGIVFGSEDPAAADDPPKRVRVIVPK